MHRNFEYTLSNRINQIKTSVGASISAFALTVAVLLPTLSCSSPTRNDNNTIDINWESKGGPRGGTAYELATLSDGTVLGNISSAIYRLPSGSDTWVMTRDNSSVGDFEEISSNLVLAADVDGILASTDDGQTWSMQFAVGDVNEIYFDKPHQRIFAATQSGLYVTDVSPIDWQLFADLGEEIQGIAMTATGEIFLLARRGNVWRSKDDGQSWEKVVDSPFKYSERIIALGGGSALLVDYTNQPSLISYDGGSTWEDFAAIPADPTAAVKSSDGSYLVGSAAGAVWKSTDGVDWEQIFSGDSLSVVFSLTTSPQGGLLLGYANVGVLRIVNGEITELINSGLPYAAAVEEGILRSNEGHLYAATGGAGVWRSTDQGASWEPVIAGLHSLNVGNLARLPDGSLIVSSAGGYVYRLDEAALRWDSSRIPDGTVSSLPIAVASNGTIYALPYYGSTLYAAGQFGSVWQARSLPDIVVSLSLGPDGAIYAGGRATILRSEGGDLWEKLESSAFESKYVSQIEFISAESAVAGVNGVGVMRSEDGGVNWVKSSSGLNTPDVRSLEVGSKNVLYLASGDGFYVSYDGSLSWYRGSATDMQFQATWEDADGSVWASTTAHGILHGTIPPEPKSN